MSMRFNTPVFRPQDNKGRTLPGAQLFFYENYSTTPKTTYANVALTNPNPHPIIADGAGKFTDIFLGIGDYRVILTDRKGQILWDRNDVSTNDLTEDVINDIERQLNEVLNLYRMQNLGEYGVADPDLEKTFTEPNAQYVVYNDQAWWTVSGTPLPYTTDSVTYPDPASDPNLQLAPNVTFNYVDTGDQDRQKETTGLSDITLINGGDDLFPLTGEGIRVAGVGLWIVPSVTSDGSALPNPAILDSTPINQFVTINGGTPVTLIERDVYLEDKGEFEIYGADPSGLTTSNDAIDYAIDSPYRENATIKGDGNYLFTAYSRNFEEDKSFKIKFDKLSNSSVEFTASATLTTTADDIVRFDKVINVTTQNFTAGDCVLIEGDVTHEGYTPTRYTDLKFVAKVRSVDGNNIELDRSINYRAENVTVSKIPNVQIEIECDLDSSNISFTNIYKVSYKGRCTGARPTTGGASFVFVQSCGEVDLDVVMQQAEFNFGVVANDISSGKITFNSLYSGGLSSGSTSSNLRGNGWQQIEVNGTFNLSRHIDSTIFGARTCIFNFNTQSNGANFFDNGSTDPNRLEAIALGECDDCNIDGRGENANDQVLELIACTDCTVDGYWANAQGTQSSEGAVIVKGASRDNTINAEIYGFNSRGLKIEDVDGNLRTRVSPKSKIFSSTQEAISIRDAAAPFSAGHTIEGLHQGFGTSVILSENSNNVIVDCKIDMSTGAGGSGVFVQNSDSFISAIGKNTQSNKQLVTLGNTASNYQIGRVSGDTPDILLTYNGNSQNEFSFEQLNLTNGEVVFGGISQNFTCKGGQIYSNDIPTVGVFAAGDFYKRESFNAPTGSEALWGGSYRLVEDGRMYDGASWIQTFLVFPG